MKNILKKFLNNKKFTVKYRIKKNNLLNKKSNNFIKSDNILYNNGSSVLYNHLNSSKNNSNIDIKKNHKINDIKKLRIDNIFYQKKKLSYEKKKKKDKYLTNINKPKINNHDIGINNNLNNLILSRGVIKRTSYKRFNNISPSYRNIELNINNSVKNSLYKNKIGINNYSSSSLSIFIPTHCQEKKNNSIKNLIYINKNKNPRNDIKIELYEKIRLKIYNNLYLTLNRCIRK